MKKAGVSFLLLLNAGLAAFAQSPPSGAGVLKLRYVTVLVKDYDRALEWYTKILGLAIAEDRTFGAGQRWLVVAPEGSDQPGIVLEVPHSDVAREDRIGKETNWVFQVGDCSKFYDDLRNRGVHFIQPPRRQPWGTTQAVFEDPYGNVFVAESQALPSNPPSRQ